MKQVLTVRLEVDVQGATNESALGHKGQGTRIRPKPQRPTICK